MKGDFQRPAPGERSRFFTDMRSVLSVPAMLLLVSVMFMVSSAAVFVRPVVPLVVEEFTNSGVETKAGLVFAAVALTSAIAAVVSGRLATRAGYRNALVVATFGAGIAYIPVAVAGDLVTLMVLMALVGVFSGAMIPMVNALIGANAPAGKHGSAFGIVGSAQALSFAVAPLLGGVTASVLGIHAGFPIVGAMLIAVSALVWLTVREPAPSVESALSAAEPATAASSGR